MKSQWTLLWLLCCSLLAGCVGISGAKSPNQTELAAFENNNKQEVSERSDRLELLNEATNNFIIEYACLHKEIHNEKGKRLAYAYYYKPIAVGQSDVEKKVNDFFEEESASFFAEGNRLTFYETGKVEALFDYTRDFSAWDEEAVGDMLSEMPFRYTVDIQVQNNDKRYLSFSEKVYWYTDTGSFVRVYGTTFDAKTGERCNLLDVLGEEANLFSARFSIAVNNEMGFMNSDDRGAFIEKYQHSNLENLDFLIYRGRIYLIFNDLNFRLPGFLLCYGDV